MRATCFALVALSVVTCGGDGPLVGGSEQAVVNPPLPTNLRLALHAKTTVAVGPLSQVLGDVASTGLTGSVLFDVNATQGFFDGFHVMANTVTVNVGARVGSVIGNDLLIDGAADAQLLGLDPRQLPPIPATTPASPGTAGVSTKQNQTRQLCPGQYGAITLGINSTLSLNGGVYHVTRLSLADGARLEPSEPVVIVVSGGVTTGIGASIQPSAQALAPMTAADIRIEVGAGVNLGDSTLLRAHVLAPSGKVTLGRSNQLVGAAWAKSISVGAQSFVRAEGSLAAVAPNVPPPCNDHNACTADQCVSAGAVAFCSNTPVPSGTSCADGNACNGDERCDAGGVCVPGTNLAAGTACPDGDVCNGDESCDGLGTCLAGSPLEVDDRNSCTADACDALAGVSHDPVPDGTACPGRGVCEAGTCSVSGAVFSEDFVGGQSAPTQCTHWNDFLRKDLSDRDYRRVTLSGSFDPFGLSCGAATAATAICRALNSGTAASVTCDGHVWNVGQCGGVELSVDTATCLCNFGSVSTVRPCTGVPWGGVRTDTCFAPSQNITVICE